VFVDLGGGLDQVFPPTRAGDGGGKAARGYFVENNLSLSALCRYFSSQQALHNLDGVDCPF